MAEEQVGLSAGNVSTISRRGFIVMAGAFAASSGWAASPPAPATIRILSPKGAAIIDPNAVVETIADGIAWAEGPVWVPHQNALLFSDPPANIMRRWSRRGGVSVFLKPSGAAVFDPKLVREAGSNGLALGTDGALLIADSGSRALVRVDLATRRRSILVDRWRGERFSSPNDLHVARSGAIYFTDPPYGFADGDASPLKEVEQNGVYRWTPGGEAVLVDGALTRPNGVALSPDERRLYVSVSDEKAPRIMAYDLDAGGMPRNSRVFLDASTLHGPGLPDGMKVSAGGILFCSAPGGLYLLSPEAEPLALIANGGPIANCAFGEDGRTLFMTANDRVLRVRLKINALHG
ncbi:SMP-30/gluconolactonase/LRE family protein [Sphingomonas oligophenolica]|uniref:SMP-30/gluconolactonase/LRE family protein n=1 Tax=Sphingomonas oligophenolica TaxID=301154 RepID=A0ABU9Y9Y5_9SPHN